MSLEITLDSLGSQTIEYIWNFRARVSCNRSEPKDTLEVEYVRVLVCYAIVMQKQVREIISVPKSHS